MTKQYSLNHPSMRYVSSDSASQPLPRWGPGSVRSRCVFSSLAFSVVYLALDNDKAGHDGAEIARRGLRKRHTAVVDWRYEGLVDDDGPTGEGRR